MADSVTDVHPPEEKLQDQSNTDSKSDDRDNEGKTDDPKTEGGDVSAETVMETDEQESEKIETDVTEGEMDKGEKVAETDEAESTETETEKDEKSTEKMETEDGMDDEAEKPTEGTDEKEEAEEDLGIEADAEEDGVDTLSEDTIANYDDSDSKDKSKEDSTADNNVDEAANPPNSTADNAGESATPANSAADNAGEIANTANSTADNAGESANPPKSTADNAGEIANPANSTADNAGESANPPKSTADNAGEIANPTNSTADNAGESANPTNSTADNAGETANPTNSTADNAGEIANPANSTETSASGRPKRIIKPKEDSDFVSSTAVKIKEERESGDEAHLDLEIEESTPRARGGHVSTRGRGRGRRLLKRGGNRAPVSFDPDGPMAETIRKPFLLGWKRELVIRNQGSEELDFGHKKQMADAYYFAPGGRKLRSMVEISDFLKASRSELTVDNFSFMKQPIYKEPEETIRLAGRHQRGASAGTSPRGGRGGRVGRPPGRIKTVTPTRTPLSTPQESTPTSTPSSLSAIPSLPKRRGRPPAAVKTEAETTPPEPAVEGDGALFPEPSNTFQIEIVNDDEEGKDNDENVSNNVTKEPEAEKQAVSVTKKRPASTVPVRDKPGPKRFKKFYHEESPHKQPSPPQEEPVEADTAVRICGMDCAGQEGKPPSLCCNLCMAMFHPACVNHTSSAAADKFTCANCSKFKKPDGAVSGRQSASPSKMSPRPVPITLTPNKSVLVNTSKDTGPIKIATALSQANTSPIVLSAPNSGQLIISSTYSPVHPLQTPVQQAVRTVIPSIAQLRSTPAPVPVSLMRNSAPSAGSVLVPPSQIQQVVTPRALPVISQFQNPPPGNILVGSRPPFVNTTIPASVPMPVMNGLPSAMQTTPAQRFQAHHSVPPTQQAASPTSMKQMTGQLLTLPPNVLKRLNLQQPLSIKLNGKTLLVSPSCFIPTADGVKIFLPPETLPSDSNHTKDISIAQGQTNLITGGKQVGISPPKQNSEEPHSNSNKSPPSMGSIPSVVPTAASVTVSSSPFPDASTTQTGNSSSTNTQTTTSRLRPGPRSKTRVKKFSSVCHFQKLHGGYDCMYTIFTYLNVADRLRASRVCRTWRNLADNRSFWHVVSLKNVRISDWDSAVKTMNKYSTESLDMRGLLHFEDKNRTWHQFTAALSKVRSVTQLMLGQCPASVIYAIAVRLPNLEVLLAEWITDSTNESTMWNTITKIDVSKLAHMKELQELRLRGVAGLTMPAFSFSGGPNELSSLRQLRQLSLTTLKNVAATDFVFLNSLENLQSLEIGEINLWTSETYASLGNLSNLRHLRLEKGGQLQDIGLADALLKLKKLMSLELIMIKTPHTLESALSQMKQLKSVSVWPDVSEQAAAVNTNTLNALTVLTNLKTLDWGIAADERTSIILNDDEDSHSEQGQGEAAKKMECIPFYTSGEQNGSDSNEQQSQNVEYVSITQLKNKLYTHMQDTKIKVFKMPTLSKKAVPEDL